MKNEISAVLIVLCVTTMQPTYAEELVSKESYLCIADQAAGFIFNKARNNWGSKIISPELKLIVTKGEGDFKEYKWVVKEVGDDTFLHSYCKNDFAEDAISCKGYNNFSMSRSDLRFLSTGSLGYWNESILSKHYKSREVDYHEGDFQPYFFIGKCSRL